MRSSQFLMNHNDILSVVTLTFNNYHELIKTINSLKGIDSVESVIVNGGSCIETKEFLEKNSQYTSISESDNGISDAFNFTNSKLFPTILGTAP